MKLDAAQLEATAAEIIRIDGDRDDDATSNLTVDQTITIAYFLRALARDSALASHETKEG